MGQRIYTLNGAGEFEADREHEALTTELERRELDDETVADLLGPDGPADSGPDGIACEECGSTAGHSLG